FVEPDALSPGWNRDRVLQCIPDAGVPCFSGSCGELYREMAFVRAGLTPPAPSPGARELGETALAFLVHPTLTQAEIARTVEVMQEVMTRATRDRWQPWRHAAPAPRPRLRP